MYRVQTTTKSGGKLVVAEKTAQAALTRVRQVDVTGDAVEVLLADGTVIDRTELEALAQAEKP